MFKPTKKQHVVNKAYADKNGGGSAGYSCTETTTLLTDESVTTSKPEGFPLEIYSGMLSIEGINAPSIRVTFNGTSYSCERVGEWYGAPDVFDSKDWSQYPFSISGDGTVQTESAGTYSIKIETVEESVEMSECFKKAVISASSLIVRVSESGAMSETWQTIHDALAKGIHVVFDNSKGVYAITSAVVTHGEGTQLYRVLVTDYINNTPTADQYITNSADGYPSFIA